MHTHTNTKPCSQVPPTNLSRSTAFASWLGKLTTYPFEASNHVTSSCSYMVTSAPTIPTDTTKGVSLFFNKWLIFIKYIIWFVYLKNLDMHHVSQFNVPHRIFINNILSHILLFYVT